MNCREEYETNPTFRKYVEAYARKADITPNEALEHLIVKETAQYYRDARKDKI